MKQDPDHIVAEGTVVRCERGAFRVRLDNGHMLLGVLSGAMRRNRIKLIPDDRVQIKISPHNLARGIICYRWK